MLKEARWFAAVALEVKDPPLVQRLVSDPMHPAGVSTETAVDVCKERAPLTCTPFRAQSTIEYVAREPSLYIPGRAYWLYIAPERNVRRTATQSGELVLVFPPPWYRVQTAQHRARRAGGRGTPFGTIIFKSIA
jgi:hypothetical protein